MGSKGVVKALKSSEFADSIDYIPMTCPSFKLFRLKPKHFPDHAFTSQALKATRAIAAESVSFGSQQDSHVEKR